MNDDELATLDGQRRFGECRKRAEKDNRVMQIDDGCLLHTPDATDPTAR
jgi:hypothetical protein